MLGKYKVKTDWHKRDIIKDGYSHADFLNLPPKVLFVQLMAAAKQPIGYSIYDEAIREYPEHFPEETERRRKWDLIPQEVHDQYWRERDKMRQKVYKDLPPSPGMVGMVKNYEAFQEWEKAYHLLRPIEKEREKELHKKYYSFYEIEYHE